MKNILIALALLFSTVCFADQLAYISKKEAKKAVKKIGKMESVILFCGCCDDTTPKEVIPIKVYYKYTDYEEYYEVFIEYLDPDGHVHTAALDLAYVWHKTSTGIETIGTLLNLEHDSCKEPKIEE